MNVWYKPRLQSVDNIIKTQVLGGEVSPKQIDAVQEEALDVVLAALNGEDDCGCLMDVTLRSRFSDGKSRPLAAFPTFRS